MKYTSVKTTKGGQKRWVFTPPTEPRLAGVVKSQTFSDGRTARFEIPKLIEKVEAYRRGELVEGGVGPSSKIKHIVNHYLQSSSFSSLSNRSQTSYETTLKKVCESAYGQIKLGDVRLNKLTSTMCRNYYDLWLEQKGASYANHLSLLFSVLLNYCISIELLEFNPMTRVKKKTHEPKSIIWTKDQVKKALDVCFNDFKYRSTGLIILMCYEWAQRTMDICHLKWSDIDFENKKVTIKQTKRGATVQLPLEGPLLSMLKEQKSLWDFQEYVVPYHRASDNAYRPLYGSPLHTLFKQVKELAGLPTELQLSYLRKTAINEMVEAQIDSTSIMQVTGHKSIQSLNPYLKHTYEGAKSALAARSAYKDS